jgi:hypothetical protein
VAEEKQLWASQQGEPEALYLPAPQFEADTFWVANKPTRTANSGATMRILFIVTPR